MKLLSRPIDVTDKPLWWVYAHCPHVHIEKTHTGRQRVWGHFMVIEYDDPTILLEELKNE